MLFPCVITPKPRLNGKGDPEYSVKVSLPTDHPELPALKRMIVAVRDAKFGKDAKGVSLPIKLGDTDADKAKAKGKDREYMRNRVILTARSKQFAPNLSFFDGKNIVEVSEDMRQTAGGKFYSGVEGTVEVNFVAYEGNGSNVPNSVVAYLGAVCSLNRGKRLGGGGAADRFANFARNMGQISDENPTDGAADLDDEIPF